MSTRVRPAKGRCECCGPATERRGRGFWWGLFYGIVPHTFCILFVVLSIVGATAATSVVQRALYVPYLFQIMVTLSLGFATLSAILYLRRNRLLSAAGVRRKWRYLSVLFGTTLAVNMLFFWVVFPAVANVDLKPVASVQAQGRGVAQITGDGVVGPENTAGLESVTLDVQIPCSGHAPLIIGALKDTLGVEIARYEEGVFQVQYDPRVTSAEEILAQPVFQYFPGTVRP